MPYHYTNSFFGDKLKRKMTGIFPQSLASMQPEVAQEAMVEREPMVEQGPMPERINVSEYLDAISEINSSRAKMSGRVNAMRGLTGRPANFSFGAIAGEAELKQRMGLRDEEIQDEILNRQRDAILRGDINNIDEQMGWYQTNGFDPHFAKEARLAAQSIFDQRGQERGFEIRETVEARGVRGAELKEDEAFRAGERFKFAKSEAERKGTKYALEQSARNMNELKSSREELLLRWAAKKWWDLQPEERTEAEREAIGREMILIAENPDFQKFDRDGRPFYGRDQYPTPPAPVDLDEKSLIDTFRNEAKVVLKDEAKEDEDFVTSPAREYFDTYKAGWNVAADDFDTARNYAEKIDKAITADPNIAPENKQAVLEKVLSNLESLEKGVARPAVPTDPSALKKQQMFEGMVQVAPFDSSDATRSTPENILAAQSNFLRAFQMLEAGERATSQLLAQIEGPRLNDYLFRRMLGMKEMHPDSRGIASELDPTLVFMRTVIEDLNRRIKEDKPNDVQKANIELLKEQELQRYADYWGTTVEFADWRRDPAAYRKRQVKF